MTVDQIFVEKKLISVHISVVAFHFVILPSASVIGRYLNFSHQQVELEAIKSEYTNVQLECNAADERAKLLASEVIGLEEKVGIFLGMFCICIYFWRPYKFFVIFY